MVYRVDFRDQRGFSLGPIGWIIVVNLAFFIVTTIAPNTLYDLGLSRYMLSSRPWTIITDMFVHAGFFHLLTNMLVLYFFGGMLRNLVGTRTFFGLFIGSCRQRFLPADGPELHCRRSFRRVCRGGRLAVMRPKQPVFIFPSPFIP
jgi:hypothetical protein